MIKVAKDKVHTKYKLKDGTIVPGVTTILNVLAKPALIHWAWDLGIKNIDYRKYRDNAAEIGTLTHALILAHFKNEKVDTSEFSKQQIDKAENCILSFFEWQKGHNIKPILVEEQLISEYYRFGGTPDLYCKYDEELTLVDFKTGGIYKEAIIQASAYRKLLEEYKHKINRILIIGIPKTEDESFQQKEVSFGQFEIGCRIFFACMEIYLLEKKLKKEE